MWRLQSVHNDIAFTWITARAAPRSFLPYFIEFIPASTLFVLLWFSTGGSQGKPRLFHTTFLTILALLGLNFVLALVAALPFLARKDPPTFLSALWDWGYNLGWITLRLGCGVLVGGLIVRWIELSLRPRGAGQQLSKMRSRGFTLAELLAVLGVLLILVGLGLPVFVAAKTRAKVSVDIGNLREIGNGRALYQSDYDNVGPFMIEPLLDGKYVSSSLIASPVDDSPNGYGNAVFGVRSRPCDLQIRCSYLTIAQKFDVDAGLESYNGSGLCGWLIAIQKPDGLFVSILDGAHIFPTGAYNRLGFDGSVRRYQVGYSTNGTSKTLDPLGLYLAPDDEARYRSSRP